MLKDLYYGRVIPWERRNIHSEEQRVITRKIEAEEGYFADKLPPDDRERFQALSELYSELAEVSEAELFSYSVSFGALLMADILDAAKTMRAGQKSTDTHNTWAITAQSTLPLWACSVLLCQ